MSTTLIGLPYRRFVRQVNTPTPQALVSTERTLRDSVEMLKTAEWRPVRDGLSVTMPSSDPTVTSSSDCFDAYKFSGAVVAQSGKQSSFVGMSAYRFTIPTGATALVNGNPANVTAASLLAFANKFLSAGLLVSAYLSDSETPETDWATLRAGTWNTGAILPDPDAGTGNAENKSATINVVTTSAAAKTYLWVIIQLYDWTEIKWEYWIEGAGMLDGTSLSITFDRNSIVKDPPSTEFYYPMQPVDVYDPLTVYPVDRMRKSGSLVYYFSDAGGVTYLTTVASEIPVNIHGVVNFHARYTLAVATKANGTVEIYDYQTDAYKIASGATGKTNIVKAEVGESHCLALKADGTVIAWGDNTMGALNVPAGLTNVVDITATASGSIALKSDGSLVYWGSTGLTGTITGVRQIANGSLFTAILKTNGTVVAYGDNYYGQTNVPVGLTNVVKIAAAFATTFAIKSDGSVVAWGAASGDGTGGVITTLSNVVDALVYGAAILAIKSDGTTAIWGSDAQGILKKIQAEKFDYVTQYASNPFAMVAIVGTPTVWRKSSVSVFTTPTSGFIGCDINIKRELILRDAVELASTVTQIGTKSGTIGIVETALTTASRSTLEISMAVGGFSYAWRTTNSQPNKIHFSLPALVNTAHDELYCRIIFLKDNNATPVDPTASIANWKTLWDGGVPANYVVLGSKYIRLTGFVNSDTVDVASTGYSGNFWMVIIPVHAPLANDSVAWNITQSGFNATSVFMLRA